MPLDRGVSDILTVAQVAEYLGLSVRTVETYRADGRMPEPTMVGRTPTWTRAQIDQWQDHLDEALMSDTLADAIVEAEAFLAREGLA